ncbi:hypothetical protein F2Q69_00043697 [Brassica cretica]|uniref:Uncharacterized protein n=1 Tax=Brassica cretica TaxID=69181 RepID=A0A8S9NIE4_BRACR|nr:hypothetical protein F2Q69_00043697 [Brassica cretica]
MSRGSVSVDVRTGVSIDADGRCRSMKDECLRSTVVSEYRSTRLVYGSTVVSEYRSTRLVYGSTVVERNRAMNRCCCRSMRSTLLCGLYAPNLQDQKVSIDDPIGISINSPFAPLIDYSIMISIDALLVKLYAHVE